MDKRKNEPLCARTLERVRQAVLNDELAQRCYPAEQVEPNALRKYRAELNNTLNAAISMAAEAAPAPARPQAREVGRTGDMSPSACLRVGLDAENDVYVGIWDSRGGASMEFCVPGSGGGKSPRTREALIALMIAIEADNAEDPSLDFWALRMGSSTGGPR